MEVCEEKKKLKLITTEKEHESLNSKYEGQINHVIFFHHFLGGLLSVIKVISFFVILRDLLHSEKKGWEKQTQEKKV